MAETEMFFFQASKYGEVIDQDNELQHAAKATFMLPYTKRITRQLLMKVFSLWFT